MLRLINVRVNSDKTITINNPIQLRQGEVNVAKLAINASLYINDYTNVLGFISFKRPDNKQTGQLLLTREPDNIFTYVIKDPWLVDVSGELWFTISFDKISSVGNNIPIVQERLYAGNASLYLNPDANYTVGGYLPPNDTETIMSEILSLDERVTDIEEILETEIDNKLNKDFTIYPKLDWDSVENTDLVVLNKVDQQGNVTQYSAEAKDLYNSVNDLLPDEEGNIELTADDIPYNNTNVGDELTRLEEDKISKIENVVYYGDTSALTNDSKSVTLKNKQDEKLYPKTTASLTYMSNNVSVESEINDLKEKTKYYKGHFATEEALILRYPNGVSEEESQQRAGWYAIVDSTDTVWVWDTHDDLWLNSGSVISAVTSVNGEVGDVVLTGADIQATTTVGDTSVTKPITGHLNDIYDELENKVTLDTSQIITGTKVFDNVIGLRNTSEGTVDQIKHINSNFLVTSGTGTNLLNIDEGMQTVSSFNRQLAFEDEIEEIQGHYVSYDQQSGKTESQKAQARANIGAGTSDLNSIKVNGVSQPIQNGEVDLVIPEPVQSIPVIENGNVWELQEGWYILKNKVTINNIEYNIQSNQTEKGQILCYIYNLISDSVDYQLKSIFFSNASKPENSQISVNTTDECKGTLYKFTNDTYQEIWTIYQRDEKGNVVSNLYVENNTLKMNRSGIVSTLTDVATKYDIRDTAVVTYRGTEIRTKVLDASLGIPSFVDGETFICTTNVPPYIAGHIYRWGGETLTDLTNFVELTGDQNISGIKDFTGTLNYNGKEVATKEDIPNTNNFVTLNTEQEIYAKKHFKSPIETTLIQGGAIDTHPESITSQLAYFINDLAFLLDRGGSCSITGTSNNPDPAPLFNGKTDYCFLEVANTTDVVEIIIKTPNVFMYNNNFGIGFGNSWWGCKYIKFELGYATTTGGDPTSDAWVTLFETNDNDKPICTFGGSGPATTGTNSWNTIRLTLSNFNNTTPRIAGVWAMNYSSEGLSTTLLSKGGGEVYGNISARTIYQNGQEVATKEYVSQNGGKIDAIKVNGIEQPIINKEVDLEVVEAEEYLPSTKVGTPLDNYYSKTEYSNLHSVKFLNSEYEKTLNLLPLDNKVYSGSFSGTWRSFDINLSQKITLKAGVKYSWSAKIKSSNGCQMNKLGLTKNSETYISLYSLGALTDTYITVSTTFTPTTDILVDYIYVHNATVGSVDVKEIMVNEGSTALPYQEYNGAIVHKKDLDGVLLWKNGSPNAELGDIDITLADNISNYSKVNLIVTDHYSRGSYIETIIPVIGASYQIGTGISTQGYKVSKARQIVIDSATAIHIYNAYADGEVAKGSMIIREIYGLK